MGNTTATTSYGNSAAELSQMLHNIAEHQPHGVADPTIGTPTASLNSFGPRGTPEASRNHSMAAGDAPDGAATMYVPMDQHHQDEQMLLQQRRWTQQQRQQRHILTMVTGAGLYTPNLLTNYWSLYSARTELERFGRNARISWHKRFVHCVHTDDGIAQQQQHRQHRRPVRR